MAREKIKRVHRAEDVRSVADKGKRAMEQLAKLAAHTHPEKNPLRRLALFERYTNHLLDFVLILMRHNRSMMAISLLETPNANLPWDQDEDEYLVQARADGDPIHQIANSLGRTPAACATRLSYLTGIPRSQIVDAYLDGELDEQPIRGLFHGRLAAIKTGKG
jgi:hypothetical protein